MVHENRAALAAEPARCDAIPAVSCSVDADLIEVERRLRMCSADDQKRFLRGVTILVKNPDCRGRDTPYSFWLGREAATFAALEASDLVKLN